MLQCGEVSSETSPRIRVFCEAPYDTLVYFGGVSSALETVIPWLQLDKEWSDLNDVLATLLNRFTESTHQV